MRDLRKPAGEPMVDVVGHVFGAVGADVIAERHLGRDDQVVRSEMHGAQVENGVDARSARPATASTT
jgi:hypothetical protein